MTESLSKLEQLRSDVHGIDLKIQSLLEDRFSKVGKISVIKEELGLPIHIPEVEEAKLASLSPMLRCLFSRIFELSRLNQEMKRNH
ncbi:hypothetical protein TH2_069 [Shewanella phage Thanatos-2]|nr:hypothetical protein TH2_069 [Shewanella phage Thanatos-2]